jgi:hypothetical protein
MHQNINAASSSLGSARSWILILTYLLTPWSRVLLEKLIDSRLVKKFPAFYGNQRFITAFTSARHLSLCWASPIQSITPQPNSWRSTLILSSHLRLGFPSGLFPPGLPTKTLYTPLPSVRATCPAHLILLNFLTRTVLGEQLSCVILRIEGCLMCCMCVIVLCYTVLYCIVLGTWGSVVVKTLRY